ncbi:hypothetical protein [Ascidiimonas sp. W6]|uniref:hypothetical protein n=1 Tax=Ascidiimonas meishanensis TaxID=3128903 RepID=UPI0030ECDCC2
MKQKSFKKLSLNKSKIINLENNMASILKGGSSATNVSCNSVPRAAGGIGCHMF